jgi:hypothetical protein
MLGLGHKGRLALRELGFTRDRQPVQKLKLLTNSSSLPWNGTQFHSKPVVSARGRPVGSIGWELLMNSGSEGCCSYTYLVY